MAEVTTTIDTAATVRQPVDLHGCYSFKVDAKGRVALPSKFRKVLSQELVVARAIKDECLYVFEAPDFDAWVEKLFIDKFGGYKESDPQHVALRRKLNSQSYDVEVDASGRIMLQAGFRNAAQIDKEVVILGNTGRFEIWDAKRYEKVDEETDLSIFFD